MQLRQQGGYQFALGRVVTTLAQLGQSVDVREDLRPVADRHAWILTQLGAFQHRLQCHDCSVGFGAVRVMLPRRTSQLRR
jgi:hypothetical protein